MYKRVKAKGDLRIRLKVLRNDGNSEYKYSSSRARAAHTHLNKRLHAFAESKVGQSIQRVEPVAAITVNLANYVWRIARLKA